MNQRHGSCGDREKTVGTKECTTKDRTDNVQLQIYTTEIQRIQKPIDLPSNTFGRFGKRPRSKSHTETTHRPMKTFRRPRLPSPRTTIGIKGVGPGPGRPTL